MKLKEIRKRKNRNLQFQVENLIKMDIQELIKTPRDLVDMNRKQN